MRTDENAHAISRQLFLFEFVRTDIRIFPADARLSRMLRFAQLRSR
jgi:hypothetical protein